jgi:next-to-BRCA1 protein 1
VFERFSDSAAAYVTLDPNNTAVYKQLYRAAKAKLKLRLKITVKDQEEKEAVMPKLATVEDEVLDPTEEQAVYEPSAPAPEPEIPEPQFSHPAESAPSQTMPFPSFAELQRKLDDLHLHNVARVNQRHSQIRDIPIQSSSTSSSVPVTQCASPSAREKWFAELAGLTKERQAALRKSYRCPVSPAASTYTVYCNNCNEAVPDEHYHCSTCDDGDYDLCQSCIDKGVLCGGDGHWMIKRFVKNGKVINSVTETIAPRIHQTESKATLVQPEESKMANRTCNCCIGGECIAISADAGHVLT